MAVNTNVYGTPEQWIDSSFNRYITNKNKVAYFAANQSRLENGVNAGKLSYSEPIDKSLSYCGLGTESALSHVGWIWLDENTNTYKIEEWQDRNVTNFAFFQQNDSNIDMSLSPDQLDYTTPMSRGLFWQELQSSWNHNKYLQPYTIINPKNFVLCIYIYAANSTDTARVDVDYKTYFSTYKDSYPNIIHAFYVPYFNNQQWTQTNPVRTVSGEQDTSINTDKRTLCYGQLDNYKPVGKDWDFYSYYFINNVFFGYYSRSSFTIYGKKMAFVFATENAKSHVQILTTGGDNDYRLPTIQYYEGMEEDILKSIACFGLYFSTDNNVAKTGLLTNNDMYIGLLDNNGIGHGEYLRGADTVNAPQNNYSDMTESGYDYTKPVDPNSYSDRTNFSNFTNSLLSSYAYYVAPLSLITGLLSPTLSALSEVASYPEPTNKWLFDSSFVFQEPVECILAWRKIFFKPATLNGSLHNISIGWFTTQNAGSQAYISQVENERYLLADIEIYPRYGDFRDYEPYTTMALFVPYCGMKELPLATFMGHHMQLYLIKNYRTGALEVLIMVDNKYWGNMTGNASIELPLSGNKSMEYIKSRMEIEQKIEDTMMNSFSSMVGNAAGATISLAHGNPAGALIQAGAGVLNAIQGVDQVADLDYQLDHLANKIVNIQKGSTSTTPCEILYPYILIKRPRMVEGYDEDIYSKTIGHATLENKMKNSLRGYIEATSPLLDGIPCTDTERKLIVKALEEGCIFDEE